VLNKKQAILFYAFMAFKASHIECMPVFKERPVFGEFTTSVLYTYIALELLITIHQQQIIFRKLRCLRG
jgi:hypothetical protein